MHTANAGFGYIFAIFIFVESASLHSFVFQFSSVHSFAHTLINSQRMQINCMEIECTRRFSESKKCGPLFGHFAYTHIVWRQRQHTRLANYKWSWIAKIRTHLLCCGRHSTDNWKSILMFTLNATAILLIYDKHRFVRMASPLRRQLDYAELTNLFIYFMRAIVALSILK